MIFLIGLIGVLKRRNIIMLFISTEIMLNACNLGLVTVSKIHNDYNGQVFALFLMAIAAAEVCVGIALCLIWYRKTGNLDFARLDVL